MSKFVYTVLVLLSIPNVAIACSCSSSEILDSFEKDDLVFSGKVISIDQIHMSNARFYEVEFEPYKTYKGERSETHKIITNQSIGACGYRFQANDHYVVFASLGTKEQEVIGFSIANMPTVTSCSQTVSTSRDDDYLSARSKKVQKFLIQMENGS